MIDFCIFSNDFLLINSFIYFEFLPLVFLVYSFILLMHMFHSPYVQRVVSLAVDFKVMLKGHEVMLKGHEVNLKGHEVMLKGQSQRSISKVNPW